MPLEPFQSQIEKLRECGRVFWSRGWSVGTSSNYSCVIGRSPLELLVTASGKDKGRLGPMDFVRVDENGTPTFPSQPKSSAETRLHCEAARDPRVGAIFHTHSIWSTILSDLFAPQGGIRLQGFEMLKGLQGIQTHESSVWIPIFENTQDIPSLAHRVSAAPRIGDEALSYGYLIRKHGMYTWGESIEDAFRHVEILEFLFEATARHISLGAAISATRGA